jgi:hypothetical protein
MGREEAGAFAIVATFFYVVFSAFSSPGTTAPQAAVQSPAPVVKEFSEQKMESYQPDDEVAKIISVADSVGYDWRAVSVRFHYGCPPSGCRCSDLDCLFGKIIWRENVVGYNIWITPEAFEDKNIFTTTVLHELAHVWQVENRGPHDRYEDFARWDFGGVDPMEATADCLAMAWGGTKTMYYDCPLDAQRYIHQLYLESLR